MKKTTLFLLCFLLIGAVFSQSETKIELLESKAESTVIRFAFADFERVRVETPKGSFEKLRLEEATPMLLEGAPEVLKLTASVIIPDRAEMMVKVLDSKYVDYTGVSLIPSKGNLTRDIDPASIPYTFGKAYQQDGFFPSKLTQLRDPYILRDYRGQTVVVYPFQYNPVQKVLRVYHELVVEVKKQSDNGLNILARNKAVEKVSEEFHHVYANQFLNFGNTKYTPVVDQGRMLIISHGTFMSSMQAFIDWKIQAGMEVDMVNVSTIGNATAIKSYVQNYYATPGLTFLLLVGDHSQVPAYSSTSGMSDNYYGFLSGNDHYPEVFVGRFSAETTDQVITQVNRSIDYELNPTVSDYYTKNLGIASSQGPGDDNEYDYQHIRNMQTDLIAYNYTSSSELFDGSQGGLDVSGNPSSTMVASELNYGRGVVLYTGHGSTTSFSSSGFNNTAVNNLTNMGMLPFIWAVACVNGNFTSNTCFAEAWMRAEHNDEPTGAVATLMSTINQSWNPPMCGQDEMVDIMVETYPTNIRRTFGGISMNGCMKMNDEYGGSGDEITDTWTCFGDPSLKIRTATPTAMVVTHPTMANLGATSFAVNCNKEGALVAITSGNQILGTASVSGGVATVTLPALTNAGTLKITATAYNVIPYQADVQVIAASGPYIDVAAVSISDPLGNNNGQADFGESISINLTLENIGLAAGTNVVATLSSASPWVTITDNSQSFGTLAASSQATQNQAFAVNVSNAIPDQEAVLFNITITDGASNTWTATHTIIANAPEIALGACTIDDSATGDNDGQFDPDETLVMTFACKNLGNAAISSLTASLSSTSTYISIPSPTSGVTSIAVGDSTLVNFSVTLNINTPLSEILPFTLTLANGNYSATEYYSFLMADYCTPSYSNGCSYGDEIDDFYFNTINQTGTGCTTGGYADYTYLSTTLFKGETYALQASTNYNNQYLSVWIDFNNDASFVSSEQVLANMYLTTSGILYTDSLTIPTNTTVGLHRMRVRVNYSSTCDDPCTNYSYGEAHDYTVLILDPQLTLSLGTDFATCPNEQNTLTPTVTGGTPPYSFLWSNSETNANISVVPSSTSNYSLTVTDATGTVVTDNLVIITYPTINVDLGPDQILLPGQGITLDAGQYQNYNWNTGQVTPQITVTSADTYSVTVTDFNGCQSNDEVVISQSLPPGWNFNITSTNHTILIPNTATLEVDGQPLVAGDYIGVFYDSLGTLACAGYTIWTGATSSVSAWGEDVGNDGFVVGEQLNWKIWKATDQMEYTGIATYMQPPVFPNTGIFQVNGMSGLAALTGIVVYTQSLQLNQGWNMISTYIEPDYPMIDSVFSSVLPEVIIAKDDQGSIFWPAFSVNSIGSLVLGKGYQVNMSSTQLLNVSGTMQEPETLTLALPQGWSIMGYMRTAPGNIVDLLSPVLSNIVIVKDGQGNAYWPQWGVNMIGSMQPGKGYQIKLMAAANYAYPANAQTNSASKTERIENSYFKSPFATDQNMTLCIPTDVWQVTPEIGSEIGVFDNQWNLVGASVFSGDNLVVSIWGDDVYSTKKEGMTDGESFSIKIWNGTETPVNIENWEQGDGCYSKNKLAVAGSVSVQETESGLQLATFPNPANEMFSISFTLDDAQKVTMTLLNELGQEIWTQEDMFLSGNNNAHLDISNYQSGCYYLRLSTQNETKTQVVNIVR